MNRRDFIKTSAIVSAGSLLLPSCEKLDILSNIKQFDIKKGHNNYIGPQFPINFRCPIHFYAYIPDSQIHPSYDDKRDSPWSRLFGIASRVFEEKDENRASFLFRPKYETNKIEITSCTHNIGEITKEEWTAEIEPNRYYEFEIRFKNGAAQYFLERTYMNGDSIGEKNFIDKFLGPYDGGPCGAYNDSYIVLKL